MSIYNALNLQPPTIAYCVLHRASGDLLDEDYVQKMSEMHRRIQTESELLAGTRAKAVHETLSRESQMLFGGLTEFLETPLQTDRDQIKKIVLDACERLKDQLLGKREPGVKWSLEGKIVYPSLRKPTERRLLQNGKDLLKELGIVTESGEGTMYESMFVVEGGDNLDVLEAIVRDRMGVYASPHGDHVAASTAYKFAAFNLVQTYVDPSWAPEKKAESELAFFFDKPKMKYEELREGLSQALPGLMRDVHPERCSLWQRKLGLGQGREFVLRCVCEDQQKQEDVIRWLHECKTPEFVSSVLGTHAALFVKQYLF